MKFSDAVIATVSLVLLGLILDAFLMVAFIPLNDNSLSDLLAFIIGFLVASLVVGYVFALKIQEGSRIEAIGIIVVLSTFTFMLFYVIWIANSVASPWYIDSLKATFNTSGWTDYEWSVYSVLYNTVTTLITIVITFIGLYVGSMLRKPKKS